MSEQRDLFGSRPLPAPPAAIAFDGETYEAPADHARLKGLLERVHDLMLDGQWHTLAELSHATGGSEASVSARLRDLRKEKYGAWVVERQRMITMGGLYRYRLVKS